MNDTENQDLDYKVVCIIPNISEVYLIICIEDKLNSVNEEEMEYDEEKEIKI